MITRIYYLIIRFLIFVFCFVALVSTQAQDEGATPLLPRKDAAVWGYYELEARVTKGLWVHYKNQFRFNENITRFDYTFFDVGVDYQPYSWMSLSGAYVLNLKNHMQRGLLYRYQVYGNVTFKHRFRAFRISSRNQFQTNIEDVFVTTEIYNGESIFYRNKVAARWYMNQRWRFQASGEAYFRLGPRPPGEDYVYRQRYILGLRHRFSRLDQIEVYYLFQNQIRQRRPDHIFVVGIGYTRSFRF